MKLPPLKVFILMQTNCQSSREGQIIKSSLHNTLKEAEKAGDKGDYGKMEMMGKEGWWDSKKQLFNYVEEVNFVLDTKG